MSLIVENYFKGTNTLLRFMYIGLINTCIGLSLIFLLLNVVGWPYWMSTSIGNGIGAIVSYFLNKNFTFKSKVNDKKGITLFVLVIVGSYIISYRLGYSLITNSLFINLGIYTEEFSVLIAAMIYTVLNYLGQRYVTFRH